MAAPNDPLWASQWGPDAAGVRSAWALTRGRPEIVVAVIDTGVDLAHPDLAGRLIPGTDLGSGDADPSDAYWLPAGVSQPGAYAPRSPWPP